MEGGEAAERLAPVMSRVLNLITKEREVWLAEEVSAADSERYVDLVVFHIYHLINEALETVIDAAPKKRSIVVKTCFKAFRKSYEHFLISPKNTLEASVSMEHLFSCFYQARRAFHYTFHFIAGRSQPSAALRASIWQSLFTRDLKRYRRSLKSLMPSMSTLITGPSGTGKELVARALGHSSYIEFDLKREDFLHHPEEQFFALNLSALPLNLIESELFGHSKGAFTGASQERCGWLEACSSAGTVFIDEIGELDELFQVKLLRVLQSRTFQRVGEKKERHFLGKFVAATNRNLDNAMAEGSFRQDFFYRICSDRIEMPSLQHILVSEPHELQHLVQIMALRMLPEHEVSLFCKEAMEVIQRDLEPNYPWPGNFRELEQCLNSILIRGSYRPSKLSHCERGNDPWLGAVSNGTLNMDQLVSEYCKRVYERCQNFEETARRLQVDRRTVKRYVEMD
jgi:transcriptional regulator with PAS, ATPase and Fis domain